MTRVELATLLHLLYKYRTNLEERGFHRLADRMSIDIIDAIRDDINDLDRHGNLSMMGERNIK